MAAGASQWTKRHVTYLTFYRGRQHVRKVTWCFCIELYNNRLACFDGPWNGAKRVRSEPNRGIRGKESEQLMVTDLLFADDMIKTLESQLNGMPQDLRILEAGCGRSWPLKLSRPYHITDINMDQATLAVRTDLHRAVVGDLRTAEFPDRSFDVIYSSYVLEHISGAEQVLERFPIGLRQAGW